MDDTIAEMLYSSEASVAEAVRQLTNMVRCTVCSPVCVVTVTVRWESESGADEDVFFFDSSGWQGFSSQHPCVCSECVQRDRVLSVGVGWIVQPPNATPAFDSVDSLAQLVARSN